MEEGFLNFQSSKIHYIKFGDGEKLLVALPGYGDPATIYLSLQNALETNYTVYAIDLPFHHKTEWNQETFSKKDMVGLFKAILKKEGKQRFELMGYSFGGRIILAVLSEVMNDLDKIYLVAPDGVQTDGMSIAMMVPFWLRKLFQHLTSKPERFDGLLQFFNKIGLISKFNLKFIRHNLSTEKRRDRIFKTWFSLNNFQVDIKKVRQLLKDKSLPVALYFGINDKIIPLKGGEKFSSGLPSLKLYKLEEGHRLLNEKLNQLLSNQLNEK